MFPPLFLPWEGRSEQGMIHSTALARQMVIFNNSPDRVSKTRQSIHE